MTELPAHYKGTERKTLHGPGPDTKGGGYRGGPKRWTGGGPAPARHIPWPEIFKHHISVCEGHLKMVEMVRKHTVEGTGNHRTIMSCVQRTQDMLREVKQISRSFVPPPNQREQVPLGSSSASMYPGYSPADHEYGKAAEEHGRAAAEARARGEEVKYDGVEYEIGQAKGVKRRTLAGIREAKAAIEAKVHDSGSGSGSGSGSDASAAPPRPKAPVTNGTSTAAKDKSVAPEGGNPFFVIDTKPTPVNLPGISHQATKRSASPPPPDTSENKKSKKQKKKHDGDLPTENKEEPPTKIEFEDISAEVDARIKAKEEKRKQKEEKKRKRESAGESAPVPEVNGDAHAEVEKPKKKKSKIASEEKEGGEETVASKKRAGVPEGAEGDGEGKLKKKRKKDKGAS